MISKTTAEHYLWGDRCDGWHLVKRDDLSIIHERMPKGTSEVRHYHNRARQFFFVIRGTLTMELNGTFHVLGVHEGIEIEPGIPHQAKNESDSDVEFIVTSQPTTRGDRVLCEN